MKRKPYYIRQRYIPSRRAKNQIQKILHQSDEHLYQAIHRRPKAKSFSSGLSHSTLTRSSLTHLRCALSALSSLFFEGYINAWMSAGLLPAARASR